MLLVSWLLFTASCTAQTYNVIFSDNNNDLFFGPIVFWGMNIDLDAIDNCCSGNIIYSDSTASDQVVAFTNNGSAFIGSIDNGIGFPSLLTMQPSNPATSLYVAPFTTNENFGFLALAFSDKSACPDATGLWLGNASHIPSTTWGIHFGCVDTQKNTLQTIAIYNDTYDLSDWFHSSYGGALYDVKRELLWFYAPDFEWDKTINLRIYVNGTGMHEQEIDAVNDGNGVVPFTDCHYSVYYDVYACMCASYVYCYYDPSNEQAHFVTKIQSYPEVVSFALIDNGQNAVFVDEDKNVFAMDVMKADWKKIGVLQLDGYVLSNPNPGAILMSFDG